MGLDMYAMRTDGDSDPVEIATWRKHNALHNWMQQQYAEETGVDEPQDFNGVEVNLTETDIDQLEADVLNDNLVPTSGFFFGSTDYTDEYKEDDLAFIAAAREALSAGHVVFYDSWW